MERRFATTANHCGRLLSFLPVGGDTMNTRLKACAWSLVFLLSATAFSATGSDPRLVNAAKNKDHETVRSLLKQHVAVDTPAGDGATAFRWHCRRKATVPRAEFLPRSSTISNTTQIS